ncbi:MAG: ribosome small subunit-dependent GTPase A [Oscillospiraceae bacterium]|jgi:ribosome biogenesis GTPase|nr:ribosome small subunit-dependent GTPase A [Oscillospiraceae bacterium]
MPNASGTGTIVKAVSGVYSVDDGGNIVRCSARGRFRREEITPLVGDRAVYTVSGAQGVLEELLPRRNAFIRPPVANLDVMVLVASGATPVTEPFLIDRMAAIAAYAGCEAYVCITKRDLNGGDSLAEIYTRAGFPVFRASAETGEGIDELLAALSGKISAFTGNSGVGKSSLLNAMGLDLKVGEVSERLGRGRHTTRHTELYALPGGAYIVDTPGFSSFDPGQMALTERAEIERAFREFAPHLGKCRFQDCAHLKEPACAVRAAVADGTIGATRYASYAKLLAAAAELKAKEYK